jgi:hypothetical protein
MKYLTLILTLFICIGCTSDQMNNRTDSTSKQDIDLCFTYPSVIDSLHIQDLYDSARWYIYTRHCDRIYKMINPQANDSSKNIFFGELALKFKDVSFHGDTLELYFDFMDKDEAVLPSMADKYIELITGMAFNRHNRNKLYMVSPNGFSIYGKGASSHFENPQQPNVLEYISDNGSKLNKCFNELARRKGI